MSLLAGVGLAFLRDRLDPAVKSAAEAHGVTGLPILAEVSS
jgi:capsular polysaccharide biosynthesis protein